MKNTLELIENNEVVATTSFEIIDIKSSVWLDTLDKKQKQEDGYTKTAFYGENLKLVIETEGIDDGTELEVKIIAKNEEGTIVEIKNDEEQPIKLLAKTTANKVTFEPFYINPQWYDKEAPLTYYFNLKIKRADNYIGENLPTEIENQLKPIGFGRPDAFKIDKAKGYLLEKQAEGTKIAYTSGKLEDVETYQAWFEDESDELDFSNNKQIDSYFDSVYMTYLFHWAPRGEFGNAANRKRVISAFNKEGARHGIKPSILYIWAVGEGMMDEYKIFHKNNLDAFVSSFDAYGLDLFEKDAKNLKIEGYLRNDFNSCESPIGRRLADKSNPPKHWPKAVNYVLMEPFTNPENGKEVCPVWFNNLENGVEATCAVYARRFQLAIDDAKKSGWNELNMNQKVYFGYHKIQNLEKFESNFYKHKSEVFLIGGRGTFSMDKHIKFVKHKAFHRFVAWRYILLGNYFKD